MPLKNSTPSQESMASRVVISTTRPSASNESIAERRNPCGVQSKWEEIFRKGVILLWRDKRQIIEEPGLDGVTDLFLSRIPGYA